MPNTELDTEALKKKYAEEREKRLRQDGIGQYIEVTDKFSEYLEDPYTPVQQREPLTDHVTFAFVGGGFAGLCTGARLKEAGIDDVRIIEKGGDFGGTWYWNRYPGAQCDTASMIYLPLLEETGHIPTEKYAHAPEILAQSQRIGRTFGLYDGALFHTQVEGLVWEDDKKVWRITTDRGDNFTAKYIGLGTGGLHVPKLPGLKGIESFKGHSFHTSRWDYEYTGGDPKGAPMDKLQDKRVAIIGTGATSVQCVPHLAKSAQKLYVFQRTPSSIDVRNNHDIDPEWFQSVAKPGWQKEWLENFCANQTGMGDVDVDLVMDGWTEISRLIGERVSKLPENEQGDPIAMWNAWEAADFEKMEEIRQRTDEMVADKETADNLKAWYRQLCKRPCFHDQYLQAFNNPSTELIDTDGKGVERISENGVVVDGKEYEVDVIIYASGFEVGTPLERRAGFDPVGRDGITLSKKWAGGMRTMHSIHVHGFPNAFLAQPIQGAYLVSNIPHNLTASGTTIAAIIAHAEKTQAATVEVTAEAEQAWIDFLLGGMGAFLRSVVECTPGYYNNEGQESGEEAKYVTGHPDGALAFFRFIDEWAQSGKFEGLSFA